VRILTAIEVVKLALKTTCIKNINFKIIKIMTGCQYTGFTAAKI